MGAQPSPQPVLVKVPTGMGCQYWRPHGLRSLARTPPSPSEPAGEGSSLCPPCGQPAAVVPRLGSGGPVAPPSWALSPGLGRPGQQVEGPGPGHHLCRASLEPHCPLLVPVGVAGTAGTPGLPRCLGQVQLGLNVTSRTWKTVSSGPGATAWPDSAFPRQSCWTGSRWAA